MLRRDGHIDLEHLDALSGQVRKRSYCDAFGLTPSELQSPCSRVPKNSSRYSNHRVPVREGEYKIGRIARLSAADYQRFRRLVSHFCTRLIEK
jgi:hypothetical protein